MTVRSDYTMIEVGHSLALRSEDHVSQLLHAYKNCLVHLLPSRSWILANDVGGDAECGACGPGTVYDGCLAGTQILGLLRRGNDSDRPAVSL